MGWTCLCWMRFRRRDPRMTKKKAKARAKAKARVKATMNKKTMRTVTTRTRKRTKRVVPQDGSEEGLPEEDAGNLSRSQTLPSNHATRPAPVVNAVFCLFVVNAVFCLFVGQGATSAKKAIFVGLFDARLIKEPR